MNLTSGSQDTAHHAPESNTSEHRVRTRGFFKFLFLFHFKVAPYIILNYMFSSCDLKNIVLSIKTFILKRKNLIIIDCYFLA